ncbi:hypothetical protein FXO37_17847 [Capsicum annuum]|nr:hypothetical protein FXO37_17847 [Capsicum annuum]
MAVGQTFKKSPSRSHRSKKKLPRKEELCHKWDSKKNSLNQVQELGNAPVSKSSPNAEVTPMGSPQSESSAPPEIVSGQSGFIEESSEDEDAIASRYCVRFRNSDKNYSSGEAEAPCKREVMLNCVSLVKFQEELRWFNVPLLSGMLANSGMFVRVTFGFMWGTSRTQDLYGGQCSNLLDSILPGVWFMGTSCTIEYNLDLGVSYLGQCWVQKEKPRVREVGSTRTVWVFFPDRAASRTGALSAGRAGPIESVGGFERQSYTTQRLCGIAMGRHGRVLIWLSGLVGMFGGRDDMVGTDDWRLGWVTRVVSDLDWIWNAHYDKALGRVV